MRMTKILKSKHSGVSCVVVVIVFCLVFCLFIIGRLDEVAPSSSIDGASRTPLAKALLFDSSLEEGDRLPLLDHVSVVIAGVFEAALR